MAWRIGARALPAQGMERETGIEPATNSLEGCDSTTELLPPGSSPILASAREPAVHLAGMTDIPVLNGIIFAGLGILVFVIAFSLVIRLAPIDLWKQIRDERNVAAAILAGAVALGICWIVAATLH